MTRLLGRSLSLKKNEPATESAAPDAPAPRKPSTRRGSRGPRRSGAIATPANGAVETPAEARAEEAREQKPPQQAPSRRRSGRRGNNAPEPISDDPMLAAMQRQTALLEHQTELLSQQQAALTRLTEAMLGAKRGGVQTQGAQIEVSPRLAIFVDVPNILYAAEATNVELHWGKVADFLSEGRTLVRAIAYSPISDDPNERTENERFVVPFLEHGYRIATKPLKRFRGGSVKANFDVELAIDVLTMADRVDVIVLVSGDGDFRRLVEIVGNKGVRIEVMAFGQSTSQDLRVVADRYIDIAGYIPELTGR